MTIPNSHCPLCQSSLVSQIYQDKKRPYFLCANCDLIFVPEAYHLNLAEEKARYDLHQNSMDDTGYQNHLLRVVNPVVEHARQGARGIDFGSGPNPVLSEILSSKGFEMMNFDPLYAARQKVLKETYDFLTCVEVVEHFRQPAEEFEKMFGLVKAGGHLCVMTERWDPISRFDHWHYISDPTHIRFYSKRTLSWIGKRHSASVYFKDTAITLFIKS